MNELLIVGLGALAGGTLLAFFLNLHVTPFIRARMQRLCLRYGGTGTLFMVMPWAIASDRPKTAPVLITVALIVTIPLVAGVVLRLTEWQAADV